MVSISDPPAPTSGEYASADALIHSIRKYNSDCNENLIRRAYVYAEDKHGEQKRESGAPFFSHPVAVAEILIEHQFDETCVVTALLHDTIEDCDDVSEDTIRGEFGDKIAELVVCVTKLTKQSREHELIKLVEALERTADTNESLDKKFQDTLGFVINAAQDSAAMAVKLVDRLHNMQTIHHLAEADQVRKARETMDIFAPLAERFGVDVWRVELEEHAFKVLNPVGWKLIDDAFAEVRGSTKEEGSRILRAAREFKNVLQHYVAVHHIDATINRRVKSRYSIWRKLKERNMLGNLNAVSKHDLLFDVVGYEIIVNSAGDRPIGRMKPGGGHRRADRKSGLSLESVVENPDPVRLELYRTLGVVHCLGKATIPRIKDYVSSPKPNGYRSLHTTIAVEGLGMVEIQIKTREMKLVAEYGASAHWAYRDNVPVPRKYKSGFLELKEEIIRIAGESSGPKHFEDLFRLHLEPDRIHCFTPKGSVRSLPTGATALDFAYKIHTTIGNRAHSAVIDNEEKALNTALVDGQTVRIRTSEDAGPVEDWLEFVRTSKARSVINSYLNSEYRSHAAECLRGEIEGFGLDFDTGRLAAAAKKKKFRDLDDMLLHLGRSLSGRVRPDPDSMKRECLKFPLFPDDVLNEAYPEKDFTADIPSFLIVMREGRLALQLNGGSTGENVDNEFVLSPVQPLAQCCMPGPDEMVIGIADENKIVSLHAVECGLLHGEPMRGTTWIDAQWSSCAKDASFTAGFVAYLNDEAGVLMSFLKPMTDAGINIEEVASKGVEEGVHRTPFKVTVDNGRQLASVMAKVRELSSTIDVVRCRNADELWGPDEGSDVQASRT
ncbi:MAG: HD domain-containing protein [Rhodobacteraceae bacterium]|nr:HD domain-containing protein [Paracoccaceae bacterium]